MGMVQEAKQTDKEKMAMYMKLSKEELSKMLIESNNVIDEIKPIRESENIITEYAKFIGK